MTSTPPFVETEAATFRGPHGPVFPGCTLRVEPGQRWSVLGPNGSGKGLLLDALMGRLPLLAGRLRHPFLEGDPRCADSVFGVLPPGSIALASMREHRQWLLARDFHQLRWHGSLSGGAATVLALLERAHVEQRNPFAVVDPAGEDDYQRARQREIARFALGPLLERPVVALSNGELHRFVLARALLRRPRLLLLDDPSAGLDVESRARLREILGELDDEGIGVIIATEREDDLPAGITHVVRVEYAAIRYLGPRGGEADQRTVVSAALAPALPERGPERVPPGVPVLEMTNASVRLGDISLLDGISLRVDQGQHWAVLGPNGSGKSTLLSLVLADNPQVYANDIRIAGWRLGPGRSI
jgi:molybdate transport system ATP-binding protein